MIEIGKINTLTILRETTVGLYLGDEDKNDVLLPNSFIKDNYNFKRKMIFHMFMVRVASCFLIARFLSYYNLKKN